MRRIFLIAAHLIWGAHGFWLPNDPRGSWSTWIRHYELYLAGGPATTVDDSRSHAHDTHDRSLRLRAKQSLKFPPVRMTSEQARYVVRGFRRAVTESNYGLLALATMVDHVHAVVETHRNAPTRIMGHLKTRATQELLAAGMHPFSQHIRANGRIPDVWVQHGWTVYLDTPDQVTRAIEYVKGNPRKAGMRDQHYRFVKPFDAPSR